MANTARRVRIAEVPMSSIKLDQANTHNYRCNDDTFSDADTADLMDGADAVLSVIPNESKATDLSAYLIPNGERQPHSTSKATPASLETQEFSMDKESGELSDLLDGLDGFGFDSPRSLLESHSLRHQTPTSSGGSRTNASIQSTLNQSITQHATLQTPAPCKVLNDRSNQTWPAGVKSIFRSSSKRDSPESQITLEALHDKRHSLMSSPQTPDTSHFRVDTEVQPDKYCINENDRSELELDASLEELLEATTDAMMSPHSKTWQFTEDEWERLEKVQEMAEILLREAEHEREAAKTWARSVHESVRLWVQEQRALEATHADSLTNDKVQLKITREALKRLKLEMEAASAHHDMVKGKLKDVIQRQDETIKALDKAAGNAPSFKSPPRSSTGARTSSISTRLSRISLSPPVGQDRGKQHVEAGAASPISHSDPVTPTKHDALPQSVPSPVSMTVTPRTQRARTTLMDGGKLVVYRNGTEKETRPDGTCVIRFPNGDVKCTLGDKNVGIVAYYHAKEKTTHIRHKNGIEIFEYPNGQVERNFPDGSKDILFPDGTKRKLLANGGKETLFPDGVRVNEDVSGKREITGKAVAAT